MADEVAVAERPVGAQVRIELSRDLRLFDITMIGIGAMIGAGIFVLTGSAARVAGPAAVLAFLINGVVTLLTAFTYAELGSAYPEAGGGYLWAKEGLPPPAGFMSGWLSWVAHVIACALYAAAFSSFAHFILGEYGVADILFPRDVALGGLTFNPVEKGITIGIVLFFVMVNYIGVHTTGKTESIITIGKVLVLGVFIAFGSNAMIRDPTAPQRFIEDFTPLGFGGILLAMGLTFIAFEGYEIIAQSGEEVKDPKRSIPRAIFLSIAIVVVIYVLTFIVALGVINCPDETVAYQCLGGAENPELAMIRASGSLLGPIGIILMVAGGLLATTSALNATVYSSSRVSFAMGRDGTLPRFLGQVHQKRQSPGNAVVVSGIVIIVFAVTLPIEHIAASADIMFLLLFVMANMSLLTLRKKRPDLDRGFWVPLYPYIPIMGIAANIFLAVYMWNFPGREVGELGPGQIAWYVAILWLTVGLVYHFFKGGREEIERAPPIRREILEVIAAPMRRAVRAGRRVLVPLRDPSNLAVVGLGAQVARERDAELIILHVIEVPLALPPKSVRFGYVDERIKALDPAQKLAREMGVDVSVVVKIAHKVYETILETAEQEGVEAMVLGWRGERPARGGRILGSNIDFLVQKAKSDVLVFKPLRIKEKLENLTLLTGHAWHVPHAAKVAALLAKQHGAQVTLLSVVPHKAVEEATIADAHKLMKVFEEMEVPHDHKIVYSASTVEAVARESTKCDLLIMGASPSWVLRKYAFGPLEDRIAKRAACPVLMLRKSAERPKPEEKEA